jgi:hypothetical protein
MIPQVLIYVFMYVCVYIYIYIYIYIYNTTIIIYDWAQNILTVSGFSNTTNTCSMTMHHQCVLILTCDTSWWGKISSLHHMSRLDLTLNSY